MRPLVLRTAGVLAGTLGVGLTFGDGVSTLGGGVTGVECDGSECSLCGCMARSKMVANC